MKIFLILFVTSLTLNACTTLAESKKNNFYLKGVVGSGKLNDVVEKNPKINFKVRQQAILSPFVGIGAGYYLNNKIRSDLTFNYYSPFFISEAANFNSYDTENDVNVVGATTVTRKAIIKSMMLTGYYDVIDKNSFSIFVGAGIGVAHIKEKVSISSAGNISTGEQIITFPLDVSRSSTKLTNNFTYSFKVGTTIKVNSTINLELAYNWQNFGKTNPQKNINGDALTKNHYKGHNISVGVRLDI